MIKTQLLCTILIGFSIFSPTPAKADTFATISNADESYHDELDDLYYVDEEGNIVADFFTDEEIAILDTVASENDEAASEDAVDYASSKIGFPYSKARRDSGTAFDCSSLIYYSYLNSGIDLSYCGMTTAAAMANGLVEDNKSISPNEIEAGDLIFYSYKKNGRYHNIDHVAMCIGNGLQIEASSSKKQVAVRNLSFDHAVDICRPSD